MPELPEMENYKNLLTPRILDKSILRVDIERAKSINVNIEQFQKELIHHRINAIERRAKHLLFTLDTGNVLLLHLMLGGWLFYGTEEEKPNRTVQVVLSFGDRQLYFIGLRLGYLHLHTPSDAKQALLKLGPEPLEPSFTEEQFRKLMSRYRSTLKVTLVDQSILSGIGNCYSDEICFYAGLLPTRRISGLNSKEMSRLYASIRAVLIEAAQYGGYMEFPLFVGDELTGHYDSRCKVYDREGEPCLRCGNLLVKEMVSSRKCFYCTYCQH